MAQNQKHHAASPTSHSACGPGGGTELGRPLRAKKLFFAIFRALSYALYWLGFTRGLRSSDKNDQKLKTPHRKPHLTQRAWSGGGVRLERPLRAKKLFLPPPRPSLTPSAGWVLRWD